MCWKQISRGTVSLNELRLPKVDADVEDDENGDEHGDEDGDVEDDEDKVDVEAPKRKFSLPLHPAPAPLRLAFFGLGGVSGLP